MENFLRRLGIAFADGLFPRRCAGCDQEGTVWCASCAASFLAPPPEPFVLNEGSALSGATAFFSYAHPSVRHVLTGWKYIGDEAYAEVMKKWIIERIGGLGGGWDAVCAVPLHSRRQNARGYNQADVIAETVGMTLNLPVIRPLARVRHTAPRARIALEKRGTNDLAGVFQSVEPVPARVLLVDDVLTTGATLEAAAQALKAAGAVSVHALTVAQGGA